MVKMGSLLRVLLLLRAALPWLSHSCDLHIGVCVCGLDGDTNSETIDVVHSKSACHWGPTTTWSHILESHWFHTWPWSLWPQKMCQWSNSQSWHMTWRPTATWSHTFLMTVCTWCWCLQSQSRMEMWMKKWLMGASLGDLLLIRTALSLFDARAIDFGTWDLHGDSDPSG